MTTALDPAKTSSLITLSNSNRTATRTSGTAYYASSMSEGSDAAIVMYAEMAPAAVLDFAIAVSNAAMANSPDDGSINWAGWDANSVGLWGDGNVWHNSVNLGAFVPPPEATDVIGVYVDRSGPSIWFWNVTKNIWLPDGPGFSITSLGSGPLFLGCTLSAGTAKTFNFDGTFVGNILAEDPAATRWDGTPVNPVFTTMPAAKGTLVLTRNDAVLKRTWVMPAVKATLALSGIAALLKRAVPLPAAVRAFALSGKDANLVAATARKMTAETGTLVLTGVATALQHARRMPAVAGVVALTGNAVNLVRTTAYQLVANAGALVLSGKDAALLSARRMVAGQGTLALVGNAASLVKAAASRLLAEVGSFLLVGRPADLVYAGAAADHVMSATPGVLALAGAQAALRIDAAPARYEPVSFASLQNRTVHFGIHGYKRLK